jgi:hypothetical protein
MNTTGGKRESSDAAQAAARQWEREALADLIAHIEAETGPVDEADVTELVNRLADR